MKKLFTKKLNKKGFTLAELLIVVAIIGVLAVIAIPIFVKQLEKAREAADIANLRDAKSVAAAYYLDPATTVTANTTLFFDAGAGTLANAKTNIIPYGKGTGANGGCENFAMSTKTGVDPYTKSSNVAGQIIQVVIEPDGNITMSWVTAS